MPEKETPGTSVLTLLNNGACEDSKSSTKKYKLFVGTWNVGGVPPSDDINLEEFLGANSGGYCDIYVLGFQEIVPLNARNVLGPEKRKVHEKWNSLISTALNKKNSSSSSSSRFKDQNKEASKGGGGGEMKKQKVHPLKGLEEEEEEELGFTKEFQCLASRQMVGVFLSVWIRSDLHSHARHSSISCVGCGIMGLLGNKGSVSIRFKLYGTSFCFVCCHLASGRKEGDEMKRNSDAMEILSRTSFVLPPCSSSLGMPQKILHHDRVIMFGDLNYRISLPEALTASLVRTKQCITLLQNDQLRAYALKSKELFQGWQEGDINFLPTYKYYINSDAYFECTTTDQPPHKRRAPAWCDRIIWHGEGIKQEEYSRCEMRLSDHRPVKGIFMADVHLPTKPLA